MSFEELYKQYENFSDEKLVKMAKTGDKNAEECLLDRYKNIVRAKARMYFLVGGDKEDIVQEGMIGMFKAIRDYDETKAASFESFADLCIKRQIITAIKTATRKKHQPLNSYVSLSTPQYDDENSVIDIINDDINADPESRFILKENVRLLGGKMSEVLSKLEKEVMTMYASGLTYQEIAKKMDRSPKSIDNALQRIKKKLEKYIEI